MGIHSATDSPIGHGENHVKVTEAQSSYLGRMVRMITGDGELKDKGLDNLTSFMREATDFLRSFDTKDQEGKIEEGVGSTLLDRVSWVREFEENQSGYFSSTLQIDILEKISNLHWVMAKALEHHIQDHGDQAPRAEQQNREDLIGMRNQIAYLQSGLEAKLKAETERVQGKFSRDEEVSPSECEVMLTDAYNWLCDKKDTLLDENPGHALRMEFSSIHRSMRRSMEALRKDPELLNKEGVKNAFKVTESELSRLASSSASHASRASITDPIAPILRDWRGYMEAMKLD